MANKQAQFPDYMKNALANLSSFHCSSLSYSINMRAVQKLLPVSSDNFVSTKLEISEGIDGNQNRPCFSLQETSISMSQSRRNGKTFMQTDRCERNTYINYIMRISVLEVMKNRWLIQITQLYKIIHALKNIWICR